MGGLRRIRNKDRNTVLFTTTGSEGNGLMRFFLRNLFGHGVTNRGANGNTGEHQGKVDTARETEEESGTGRVPSFLARNHRTSVEGSHGPAFGAPYKNPDRLRRCRCCGRQRPLRMVDTPRGSKLWCFDCRQRVLWVKRKDI